MGMGDLRCEGGMLGFVGVVLVARLLGWLRLGLVLGLF